MGGYGSGRTGWRRTVESCLTLDTCYMQRKGLFWGKGCRGTLRWRHIPSEEEAGSVGYRVDRYEKELVLFYTWTGEKEEGEKVEQLILLDTTSPHFGGLRYWVLCPGCGRRCSKLYACAGRKYFSCRLCYDLTYQSSNDSRRYDSLFRWMALEAGVPFEHLKRAMKALRRG